MYKAAYGDLRVPQRFVVPNMKPWPTAAHNLRLGKVVANIRATGRFLQNQPARQQVLDEMGFVWRVRETATSARDAQRTVTWEQVLTALQAYRENISATTEDVPVSFTVPSEQAEWPESVWGLPLGRQLQAVKTNVLPNNANARAAFAELGVFVEDDDDDDDDTSSEEDGDDEDNDNDDDDNNNNNNDNEGSPKLSVNDIRFQKVYTALQTYKKMKGDLLVPQPFVVPENSDEWPEETWGLRLGARVNAIRSQGTFVNNNPERRQLLDDLDFIWLPPKSSRRRGRRTSRADEEEEEADVGGDETEMDAASDAAAAAMDSLLQGSFNFDQDFGALGQARAAFLSDDTTTRETSPEWNLEGAHMPERVSQPVEEPVSADEEYSTPESLADSLREATDRALECGVIEGMTENKRVIKGKREKAIPWFNDDFGEDFVFEDVVEALTIYKNIYGDFLNLTTGCDFVVPAPEEVTGFLDSFEDDDLFGAFDMDDASSRAAAAIANFDDDIDDDNNKMFDSSEDFIAAEIRRLQEEVEESAAPETESSVATTKTPSTKTLSDTWPEHLASMALGNIVDRIRDGSLEVKHLPKRKEQLDALDFDWGDDMYFIDIPFEKAMCAMYAYYLIRGDMFVYEDFVMPDEDPWPQALAGYEIGKAVRRIRELQNFLEAYHPDKVSLLRMIDFVWFSETMALPLDPNEEEMTSEQLLLSAFGHPDYAKMIDIPMGLPDRIVADGPFYETNGDPKLWWRKWHNWDYVKDYWYQQGRRDNAYVLRGNGYPQMADEHEAKYGPGLFKLMNATLQDIEENGVEGRPLEEQQELLQKLNFYRQEMLGCTDIHPHDRDQLLVDLDTHMLKIVKDTNLDLTEEDEATSDEYEGEYEDEYEEEGKEEEDDDDDEIGYEYEEEFDVENELGLGDR